MNETYTFLAVMGSIIIACATAIWKIYVKPYPADNPVAPPNEPAEPVSILSTPKEAIVNPLDFFTPKAAFHATRVLCDEMGLPLGKTVLVNGVYYQPKDIVCACIYQESRFKNTAVGRNRDKEGTILSTDWGIVQVNDTPGWHIGPGLRFSSVEDVLTNQEKAVRWVIGVMKTTGKLQPWSSYTSGAYKQWLVPTSPMWALRA